MSATKPLNPHPRLYMGPGEIARLRQPADRRLLQIASRAVTKLADEAAASPVFQWERNTHNAHLVRARRMQGRVVTLLVEWLRTGDRRYRDAAVEHVAEMGRWDYWSWIAWRDGNADPNAVFDLSYGENSATLAVAYDLLYDALNRRERSMFVDIARRRSLIPCLKLADAGSLWWWKAYRSNWLTVCGGGAGLLCLAMHEDAPEARRLLPRLDRQLIGYMRNAQLCGGGWNEGVGYWNYGMRYGFMYWLSHERATGRSHPAMRLPAARRTLWFPADFSPNDVGTGFGDVAVPWVPEPFHYAAAERFGDPALIGAMDDILGRNGFNKSALWPAAAEYLLLRTRTPAGRTKWPVRPTARLYSKMDWGYLADRMPKPGVYLSFRGGTTADPHSHLDLLSFNCVVGDEAMLAPAPQLGYIDTTFSDRCYEMFEKGWFAKNTIVIGGVGLSHPASVRTTSIRFAGADGFRLDAGGAIRINYRGEQVRRVVRAFLMLNRRAFLILDRIQLRCTNAVEARFCTPVRARIAQATATLIGRRRAASMSFAASVPCRLATAQTIPTRPQTPPATLVRWCTTGLERDVLLATLIAPGRQAGRLAVQRAGKVFEVDAAGRGFQSRLRVTAALRPA